MPMDPLYVPRLGFVAASDDVITSPETLLDPGRYRLHVVARGDRGPPGQMRLPTFGISTTLPGEPMQPAGVMTSREFEERAGFEITVSEPCTPVAAQLLFQDNACHECAGGEVQGDRNVWFKDIFFRRSGT